MLNSKQRSKLKAIASKEQPIVHIGKGEINDNIIKQAIDAIKKRELIKLSVLENSDYNVKEAGEIISKATGSEVVCTIGRKIVLYKRNNKKPVIEL